MLATAFYRPLISASAMVVGLPWWRGYAPAVWLEALILQESGGNSRARRYERHQDQLGRKDASSDGDLPDVDDGELEDDASYGLCQVMGSNVRRLVGVPPGTKMSFGWTLLPISNIALGLRVLTAELAAVDHAVPRALARFNGGPTGDALDGNGKMRRQIYVDGVAAWAERVQREVGGGG